MGKFINHWNLSYAIGKTRQQILTIFCDDLKPFMKKPSKCQFLKLIINKVFKHLKSNKKVTTQIFNWLTYQIHIEIHIYLETVFFPWSV